MELCLRKSTNWISSAIRTEDIELVYKTFPYEKKIIIVGPSNRHAMTRELLSLALCTNVDILKLENWSFCHFEYEPNSDIFQFTKFCEDLIFENCSFDVQSLVSFMAALESTISFP